MEINIPEVVAEVTAAFERYEKALTRLARPKTDMRRTISNTVVTTFGRDLATANTEFERVESGRRGRQSQTWARIPEGWRVVSAHVSFMPTT